MAGISPETPNPLSSIYQGRGEEVDQFRPIFTGDVLRSADRHDSSIVLQHPCALRTGGVELVERLLVAAVLPAKDLPLSGGKFRSDWAKESLRVMRLPDLEGDGTEVGVDFRRINIVLGGELQQYERVAILSLTGVNLLLQRWIRHNARVIIPTATIAEQVVGPFEEADLAADWCSSLADSPADALSLLHEFDTWIKEPLHPTGGLTRQAALEDPQTRPAVRRALQQRLRAHR